MLNDRLAKGVTVICTGRLKQDTWEAKDGSNRSKLKLTANEVQIRNRVASTQNNNQQNNVPEKQTLMQNEQVFEQTSAPGEDIPF